MTPRSRCNTLLWTTFGILLVGLLAGYDDGVLEECVAQVLFLASCATAVTRVESVLGRGRDLTSVLDLEEALECRNTWTRHQQSTIALMIVVIDGFIVTIDRTQAGPRVLLLGSLAIVLANHVAPGAPRGMIDEFTTRLSTTILQVMVWSVSQPAALDVGIPTPSTRRYTLVAMGLPVLRPVESEVTIILIMAVYQVPQWLMAWTLLSATSHEPHMDMHTKRGNTDSSEWVKALVGPLLATALTMLLAVLLHFRDSRRYTGGGEDNSIGGVALQELPSGGAATTRHPGPETDAEAGVEYSLAASSREDRPVEDDDRAAYPIPEEIANSDVTVNSYPEDSVLAPHQVTVVANEPGRVVEKEYSSSSDKAVTPSEIKSSQDGLPRTVGPTDVNNGDRPIECLSLGLSVKSQDLQSVLETVKEIATEALTPSIELSSSIPEPEIGSEDASIYE